MNNSIKTFIKRILSSPIRSLNKKTVLKAIEENDQLDNHVINIHRIDTKNAGDYYCAPHHYFSELKDTSLDIFDYKNSNKGVRENWIEEISNNNLIIGGGGLLNRKSFSKQMKLFELLAQNNKKVVLWGLGHNSGNSSHFGHEINYNVDLSSFGIVGTRDYGLSPNWVPCVSCLHSVFDKKYDSTRELGIIFHKKTMKNKEVIQKFKDYPQTSNTTKIDKLVEFIGTSETIITDSYHAMYWGMLLEKKVVVVPNSSKFFDFKYKPVFSDFQTCIQDARKANKYFGLIEECREINLKFAASVFDYLELEMNDPKIKF